MISIANRSTLSTREAVLKYRKVKSEQLQYPVFLNNDNRLSANDHKACRRSALNPSCRALHHPSDARMRGKVPDLRRAGYICPAFPADVLNFVSVSVAVHRGCRPFLSDFIPCDMRGWGNRCPKGKSIYNELPPGGVNCCCAA